MDPANNTSNTPTPTSVMPPVAQASTVNPVATPTAAPVNPVVRPAAAAPVNPIVRPTTEPVNPVITPVAQATLTNPVVNPVAQAAPVNPVFRPTGGGLVSATDPITMPTPPKAPDPVEEELKAPLKAAEPVPGSIGSAISVPSSEQVTQDDGSMAAAGSTNIQQTPSVSFTDPAMTAESQSQPTPSPKVKKKTSKTTLTLLVVVAAMVVIALVAVLVMQLM